MDVAAAHAKTPRWPHENSATAHAAHGSRASPTVTGSWLFTPASGTHGHFTPCLLASFDRATMRATMTRRNGPLLGQLGHHVAQLAPGPAALP
jgi:hypothetical protein